MAWVHLSRLSRVNHRSKSSWAGFYGCLILFSRWMISTPGFCGNGRGCRRNVGFAGFGAGRFFHAVCCCLVNTFAKVLVHNLLVLSCLGKSFVGETGVKRSTRLPRLMFGAAGSGLSFGGAGVRTFLRWMTPFAASSILRFCSGDNSHVLSSSPTCWLTNFSNVI